MDYRKTNLAILVGTLPDRFLTAVEQGKIEGPSAIIEPLVSAFEAINAGEDANRALGLTAPRGRPSDPPLKQVRDHLICGEVAEDMATGHSKNEAITRAEESFGVDESTVRRALRKRG